VTKGAQKLAAFNHQLHNPSSPVAPLRGPRSPAGPHKSLRQIKKAADRPSRFAQAAGWTATTRLARVAGRRLAGADAARRGCPHKMQERRRSAAPPRLHPPPEALGGGFRSLPRAGVPPAAADFAIRTSRG
jgi:hypothetical protein